MLFNSYIFLFLFLPFTLMGYHLLGTLNRRRLSCLWIVMMSLLFYGWWNPTFVLLIMLSIVFNYHLSQLMLAFPCRSKFLLWIGIICNLGILAYFKYTNFFIQNWNILFHADMNLQDIILPIGLSFFTFEQIAYLVDTHARKAKHYQFLDYCYFVSFFPRLIAGPIIRHDEVLTQIENQQFNTLRLDHVAIGFSVFFIGLFKKVIIADNLATIADPSFNLLAQGHALSFQQAWLAALAYTAQLYFDFSGYSDMAIGLARLFGIVLPLNFNSPYKSTSIIDFWRNWNISLSRFLRDYLYIPLGGNQKGKLRRYINLILTMLLGGLWHGANWTFVVWGGLHGLYLTVNHAWRRFLQSIHLIHWQEKTWYRLSSWCLTFLAVVFAWVFFRAHTFSDAQVLLHAMFSFHFGGEHISKADWLKVMSALSIAFILKNVHEIFAHIRLSLDGDKIKQQTRNVSAPNWLGIKTLSDKLIWTPSLWWAVILSGLFVITAMSLINPSSFIYFEF